MPLLPIEHKEDGQLKPSLDEATASLEAYHWCVDRNICPSRFFFPLASLLNSTAKDRSINDKIEAAKASLLSQAVDLLVLGEPIYVNEKLFRVDATSETNPMLRFEKDMWNLARQLDWEPYEDTNKPEPGIWKTTKDDPHAECVITPSKPSKKTLPNLQKATADPWKSLLVKLFANLANPSVEVMHDITDEEMEAALADEDKSRLLTWRNSNHLQEDLPDGVLNVMWRMLNERYLYPEAYD
jgi:hypothetical protein